MPGLSRCRKYLFCRVPFGSPAAFAFEAGDHESLSSDIDVVSARRVPETAAQDRAWPGIAGREPAAEACPYLGCAQNNISRQCNTLTKGVQLFVLSIYIIFHIVIHGMLILTSTISPAWRSRPWYLREIKSGHIVLQLWRLLPRFSPYRAVVALVHGERGIAKTMWNEAWIYHK